MVSIENGGYRLSCIENIPPGNIKVVFEFASAEEHPVYGNTKNLNGEIPLLRPQEQFPISKYFQLSKAEQDELHKSSVTRLGAVYDNFTEEELKTKTFAFLVITGLLAPRFDPHSSFFNLGFDTLALAAYVDDMQNTTREQHSEITELDRMYIRNIDQTWEAYSQGLTTREHIVNELLTLLSIGPKFIDHGHDLVRRIEAEFPNGLTTGFKHAITQLSDSRQAICLAPKINDPSSLSEETHKIARGHDTAMGPTVEISAAFQGFVVPDTLRKSLLFQLMRSRALEFMGLTNDLLGLMKDVRLDEAIENHILRRVIQEQMTIADAFESAQKRLNDLFSDLSLIMNRLLAAFPEEAGLAGYIQSLVDMVDGHTVCYVVSSQINYRWGKNLVKLVPADTKISEDDLSWSLKKLNTLSKSFAFVTAELPMEIQEVVVLFYLALRALDTIEDDMHVEPEIKRKELLTFHQKLLQNGWTFTGYGTNSEEVDLLKNFNRIINRLSILAPKYMQIISHICRKMGFGMEKFVGEKTIISIGDLDEYCQIVAGLVGEGLSEIWIASGLENVQCANTCELMTSRGSSLGMLLQKVNIIRDLREDSDEGRYFWPQETVDRYVGNKFDLFEVQQRNGALKCLNHLILNALTHVMESIQYLIELKNLKIFRFCAIPAAMAISTLAECYNNYEVFEGKVKIRKSEAFKTWERTTSSKELLVLIQDHLQVILRKSVEGDSLDEAMKHSIDVLLAFCSEKSIVNGFAKEA